MKKFLPVLIVVCLTSLFLFFYGSQSVRSVQAQCATSSSCNTCHQVQNQHPVNTTGDWHIDHANYDLCADCHKGNAAASDQSTAHENRILDLSGMVQSCANCHPDDYGKFYGKYALELGISTTPQIQLQSPLSGLSNALCVTPAAVNPEGNPVSPNAHNLLFLIILSVIILAGAVVILVVERRHRKVKKEKR